MIGNERYEALQFSAPVPSTFPLLIFYFFHGSTAPSGPRTPPCRGFEITPRYTKVGRIPLDESQRLISLNTQLTSDIHVPGGIRTHNSSKRAAANPRLIPRGHRDRRFVTCYILNEDLLWLLKFVAISVTLKLPYTSFSCERVMAAGKESSYTTSILAHHYTINKETKDRIHYFAFCESSSEWRRTQFLSWEHRPQLI